MGKIEDFAPPLKVANKLTLEDRFRLMAETFLECFAILDEDFRVVFANSNLCNLLDMTPSQLQDISVLDLAADDCKNILSSQIELRQQGVQSSYEIECTGVRGQKIYALILSTPYFDNAGEFRGAYSILTNIRSQDGDQQSKELSLFSYSSALALHEQKKAEEVKKKVMVHAELERSLLSLEKLLAQKNNELLVAKEALRDLLHQGSDSIVELERKMFFNLQQMVFPYLKKLKHQNKDVQSSLLIDVIWANLEKISSSFSQRLLSHLPEATPREIEVAEFVRLGKTTKEISSLLDISSRTVESYRDSLRVKLKIKNKKINLRSYLASLS